MQEMTDKKKYKSFEKQLRGLRSEINKLYNPIDERYKTMNRKELFEMISGYNTKQNELQARYPEAMKDYKEEVWQEQLKAKLKENADAEALKASNFIKSVDKNLHNAYDKKVKARFPLKADNDIEKMLLSEAIHQRAFNFLSVVNENSTILNELQSALNTDLNYFSALIDILNAKRPDPVNISDQKTADFYRSLDKLNNQFSEKNGLSEVEAAITELETIKVKAASYFKALIAGEVNYLDADVIKKMTPQEISKAVDTVNNSLQYQAD